MSVFEPHSVEWEAARQLFDASLARNPSLVLQPQQLESALELVTSLQRDGCEFTLKSGGHSAAGLSVADDLPLVDLSKLRRVELDRELGIVVAQGGALMADLDAATARASMATTGGTVSHTGVVGLACGGGLGWLMGRFGLACDNIDQALVVADGQTQLIGQSSRDFAVLRGAGTSLGFIAELTMRVHPIESTYRWTTLRLGRDVIWEALQLLEASFTELPDCVGCSLTVESEPPDEITGIVDLVFPEEEAEGSAWCRKLAALPSKRQDQLMTYRAVQCALDADFPFGRRSYRRSICVDSLYELDLPGFLGWLATRSDFRLTLTIDVAHGMALDAANRASSCFPRRRYTCLLICRWNEASHDELGRRAGRDMVSVLAGSMPNEAIISYGNYSSELADSRSAAGGAGQGY